MKTIKLALQPPRPRRHRALFDNHLPFRGRKQEPKTLYQRQVKHPRREQIQYTLE